MTKYSLGYKNFPLGGVQAAHGRSKKLTGSQLSLPHGTNKKLKCKNKNKIMSVIGPVQSRYREAVQ